MSNTYKTSPMGARGVDVTPALELIKRERTLKLVAAMGSLFAVFIALFGAEAAMLSQEQAPDAMLDPQPGAFAPYEPD